MVVIIMSRSRDYKVILSGTVDYNLQAQFKLSRCGLSSFKSMLICINAL
ncbi:hypothetical protein C3B55_00189 [Candidatus Pseudomonas adelgestsugas]|uniref:Uncharacterized protein n=1 Tax=Candidatus Pseudomonas adelgestsugas TaxID=1302376 RepID=A0ABX5R894_9PSED|nr:hypothetical protein C3B55_00189 [Candidatus Pseudomonas adelgestsugas]